jgi:quinol monooxygenase YgiN
MVTVSLSLRALLHKRGEVLSAMETLLERMRNVPGCARTRLLADVDDQNAFTLSSEWCDADTADAFFDSREFQIFRGIHILLRDDPFIVLDEVQGRITRSIRDR